MTRSRELAIHAARARTAVDLLELEARRAADALPVLRRVAAALGVDVGDGGSVLDLAMLIEVAISARGGR